MSCASSLCPHHGQHLVDLQELFGRGGGNSATWVLGDTESPVKEEHGVAVLEG